MLIRYARLSDAQLEEMLDTLVEQIGAGIASITYNGQTITYSSVANITTAIEGIEKELTRRLAAASGLKKKKGPVYPRLTGKGF